MFQKIILLCGSLILLSATACGIVPVPGSNPIPTPPPNISVPIQRTLTPTVAPTNTPVPPTATATVNPAANPLDGLKKLVSNWASIKSFRAKVVRTGGAAAGESGMEYVAPDRFHIVGKTSETIIIGNTLYTKTTTGTQWTKQTLPQGYDLSFGDFKKLLDQLNATADVKFIGPDILDGAPMLVYQYTITGKFANTTFTTVTKTWVAADGLPRKSESTSSTNPGGKTTTTFYDYNATNIVIEPPIK